MNENIDDEKEKFINDKNENRLPKENSVPLNFNYIFDSKEEEDKNDEFLVNQKSKEIICPKCEEKCNIDINSEYIDFILAAFKI